ncbi:MAG: Transcriptional regulator, AraC family, partial [uncultured Rubrobacteraceae bacterium]
GGRANGRVGGGEGRWCDLRPERGPRALGSALRGVQARGLPRRLPRDLLAASGCHERPPGWRAGPVTGRRRGVPGAGNRARALRRSCDAGGGVRGPGPARRGRRAGRRGAGGWHGSGHGARLRRLRVRRGRASPIPKVAAGVDPPAGGVVVVRRDPRGDGAAALRGGRGAGSRRAGGRRQARGRAPDLRPQGVAGAAGGGLSRLVRGVAGSPGRRGALPDPRFPRAAVDHRLPRGGGRALARGLRPPVRRPGGRAADVLPRPLAHDPRRQGAARAGRPARGHRATGGVRLGVRLREGVQAPARGGTRQVPYPEPSRGKPERSGRRRADRGV